MTFLQRIFKNNFFIKLRNWEYWPFGIVQAPFFLYWLWFSFKARSLFFFSATNPGILMGGMLGESKFDVQKKLPFVCTPNTILVTLPVTLKSLLSDLKGNGFQFPVIFKPDFGERGWMVQRINNEREAQEYLTKSKVDFIVQELVELPLEFGVFYVRYPSEATGKVVSIVGKEMLYVEGDGTKTLKELILEKERAKLQWPTLKGTHQARLNDVLSRGTKLELVSIGNHCLGTKFLNCNGLINEKLSASFDRISQQVEGFYFGRYDLRVASLEDLENGIVKVVELNGCGAEPGHIYEPGYSLWRALCVLSRHWRDIYRISRENHERGVPYLSFQEGKTAYEKFMSLKEPS